MDHNHPTHPVDLSVSALERAITIASRDANNLYLTSLYFADKHRYWAFCAFYAVMRVVDDRVDELDSRSEDGRSAQERVRRFVESWRAGIEAILSNGTPDAGPSAGTDPATATVDPELIEAFAWAYRHFPVPASLWKNFFDAMIADIDRPRFATYAEFLDYSEGATVAPTTIFLYLIVAQRGDEPVYRVSEDFQLIECGRSLGIFAYLAHILRDLALDLGVGEEGLIYLATEDMAAHGVDEALLFENLEQGRSSDRVRRLAEEIAERSRQAMVEGVDLLAPVVPTLAPDGRFILDLIVGIYAAILDRVEEVGYDLFLGTHHLSLDDKMALAQTLATRNGFELEAIG